MANINPIKTNQRTLDTFKGKMIGGGARSNLFECELFFPDDVFSAGVTKDQISDKTRFLVKSANLPASNINVISVPFRGRNLKIAGDRTFDPWTITVINDTDFSIRTAFERWMNLINKHEDNAGKTNPNDYQKDVFVRQLGRAQTNGLSPTSDIDLPVLKQYKFYGVFPTAVSAIDISYDLADTIEEFTVDLQVQWWDALDSNGSTQLGTNQTA